MNAMNQNDIPTIDENISRWAEKARRLSDERFEQLRLLYPSNQTLTENQAFLRGLHFAVDIYHQHNGVVNPGTEAVEEKLAAWSRCYMRQLYDRAMPPTETPFGRRWPTELSAMSQPTTRPSLPLKRRRMRRTF